MIYKILLEKIQELKQKGNVYAVNFSLLDISYLSDPNELLSLKLKSEFPENFKPAQDECECAEKIINGDSAVMYRALELCVFRNRVLAPHVYKIFPEMRKI